MGSSDVGGVISALVPFALAGAFVPSWTKHVIILLGSKRPLANAGCYIAGNVAFRLLLAAAVLLSFRLDVVQRVTDQPPGGQRAYLVLIGLGMVSLSIYLIRKQPNGSGELPGWLRALEAIKPWMSFAAGVGMMAAPGVQYVYYLGGAGVVAHSTLSATTKMLLVAAFTVFVEFMLLAPVVVYSLGGEKSAGLMGSFKTWLARNEFKVFGAVLGLLGVYVILTAL